MLGFQVFGCVIFWLSMTFVNLVMVPFKVGLIVTAVVVASGIVVIEWARSYGK